MHCPHRVGWRVFSTDVLVPAILWDTVSSTLENGRVVNREHSLVRHMNLCRQRVVFENCRGRSGDTRHPCNLSLSLSLSGSRSDLSAAPSITGPCQRRPEPKRFILERMICTLPTLDLTSRWIRRMRTFFAESDSGFCW